jgi:hypothetical protein
MKIGRWKKWGMLGARVNLHGLPLKMKKTGFEKYSARAVDDGI